MSIFTNLKKTLGLALVMALGVSVGMQVSATELKSRQPVSKSSPMTKVNPEVDYTHLVVKFKEGTAVRPGAGGLLQGSVLKGTKSASGLDNTRFQTDLSDLNSFLSNKGMQLGRKFALPESVLNQLREKGQARSGRQLADLNLYFELPVVGKNSAMIEQMVNFFNGLSVVEIAYAQPKDQVAAITPSFQDYNPAQPSQPFQGYLNPTSEGGIDAKYAWTLPGGKGQGVKIVDVENAWNPNHEDLPELFHAAGTMYTGDASHRHHGTAVLGVLGALENEYGVTGIASQAQIGYASAYSLSSSGAIANAANAVGEGGIVLIELHREGPTYQETCSCNDSQCNLIPVEYWQADFDAIQTATANGVIVVEAAGNGSANLDASIYENKFNRALRDSGAILVGASASASREPMCWTNYGERVDLHGWGENVMTLGYGYAYKNADDPDNENYWYRATFSGTSSASPIVVGAVAAIQGISIAQDGQVRSASDIRNLLVSTGTVQDVGLDRKIGVLPNLREAISQMNYVCQEYTATNSQHEAAGRAYSQKTTSWWMSTTTWYANGSDENLGTSGTTSVTLHQPEPGYFAKGVCPTPDTTAPVITLVGNNPLEVMQGATYQEPGATATDDRDGDLSAQLVITGSVNTAAIGEYTRFYNVSDSAGNAAETVTRTIQVVPAPPCQEYTATNSQHETAGRARKESKTSWWTSTSTWYAIGSGDNMGTSGTTTQTLKEQPGGSGYFALGSCPSEPQPPSIDGYQITKLTSEQLIISGQASDPDNDLESVGVILGFAGEFCEGTTQFTCTIDLVEWGLTPGTEFVASLEAKDALGARSEQIHIDITVPADQPPVIDWAQVTVSGNDATFMGSASDPEGEVFAVVIHNGGGGFQCDTNTPVVNSETLSFDCTDMTQWRFTLHDLPEGEFTGYEVRAVDGEGAYSEPVVLSFTISGQSAPVIDSYDWNVSGTTFTVTGTASDADGDLASVVLSGLPVPLTCQGTSSFTCTASGLSAGNYSVSLKATDVAGNQSAVAGPINFTVEVPQQACFRATNSAHGSAGRATLMYNILYYSVGGNDYLGMGTDTTSLQENSPGVWKKVTACP